MSACDERGMVGRERVYEVLRQIMERKEQGKIKKKSVD